MSELNLSSSKIFELGNYITRFLSENGVSTENDLVIKVTSDELRKIDEDLYFRNKPEGKDFVPSENDLIVKFENLNIIFTVEDNNGKLYTC